MHDGDSAPSPLFLTTRWSVVLAAQRETSPSGDAALETLCRLYWYPLYAYVRRSGQDPHDAQDLTQEFFARLLAKDWLRAAAQERGRFRTFLLVALKRFMAKEWHRATAQKRGGKNTVLPLDTVDAERRYAGEPVLTADEVFDRRWAMTLIEQTLERLRAEYQASGKAAEYGLLQEWLTAARGEIPYQQLAEQLGTSAGAARVAVHRLRQRFRDNFRENVSHTVAEPAAIEDEMRHLASILGNHV
jgi:RNA polymerase sigma-70 factor (ECF subfamily)